MFRDGAKMSIGFSIAGGEPHEHVRYNPPFLVCKPGLAYSPIPLASRLVDGTLRYHPPSEEPEKLTPRSLATGAADAIPLLALKKWALGLGLGARFVETVAAGRDPKMDARGLASPRVAGQAPLGVRGKTGSRAGPAKPAGPSNPSGSRLLLRRLPQDCRS